MWLQHQWEVISPSAAEEITLSDIITIQRFNYTCSFHFSAFTLSLPSLAFSPCVLVYPIWGASGGSEESAAGERSRSSRRLTKLPHLCFGVLFSWDVHQGGTRWKESTYITHSYFSCISPTNGFPAWVGWAQVNRWTDLCKRHTCPVTSHFLYKCHFETLWWDTEINFQVTGWRIKEMRNRAT